MSHWTMAAVHIDLLKRGRRPVGILALAALVAWTAHSCTSLDDVTAPPCVFSLSSTSASFGTGGGTGTIGVHAASACQWTVQASDSWVSFQTPTSGSGDATVGFTIDANPGTQARSVRLDISGQTFTVSQAGVVGPVDTGPSCSYATSPSSASFSASGGPDKITVSTASGCLWSATAEPHWVTIASGNGSGNGVVNYIVAANSSNAGRTGAITVAGKTVTVSQAGRTCDVSVSSNSVDVGKKGGQRTIRVTTDSGCSWTATTNTSWISITAGAGGTGNGTVRIAVAANTTRDKREGAVVIANRTVKIKQDD